MFCLCIFSSTFSIDGQTRSSRAYVGGLGPLLGPVLAVLGLMLAVLGPLRACVGCLGAYVGGLGPLLGPMLAVLGRSEGLCRWSWERIRA